MTGLFVAVDIGCIECGEPSAVLGVFTRREEAEATCAVAKTAQQQDWHGQHHFEVFEVAGVDGR